MLILYTIIIIIYTSYVFYIYINITIIFHVSYIYIYIRILCLYNQSFQNEDGKDNKNIYILHIYILMLIYFLYVEIKYINRILSNNIVFPFASMNCAIHRNLAT